MTSSPSAPTTEPLQFDAAVPAVGAAAPAAPTCAHCASDIRVQYFACGGAVVCTACKRRLEAELSGAGGSLTRAVLFGFGAAVAAAALYYAVREITGYEIGLVAIVVGYMVGWAVRRAAPGGGRRFQLVAVMLTYLAIGATYVPYFFQGDASAATADVGAVADSTAAPADPVGHAGAATTTVAATDSVTAGAADAAPLTAASFALGVGGLVLLALSAPLIVGFVEMPSSLILLAIVAFALHQAWKMTGRVPLAFEGPFRVGGDAPREA
jgi:hypothetical protein